MELAVKHGPVQVAAAGVAEADAASHQGCGGMVSRRKGRREEYELACQHMKDTGWPALARPPVKGPSTE